MGNINKLLNPPEFDWKAERCIKSLKLFRGILRSFGLRKFSNDPRTVAMIGTDKCTLDEFLAFTGDFTIKSYSHKRTGTEYWLKCVKTDIGLQYKKVFSSPHTIPEFSSLYYKWDDEYFDQFKGFTFPGRYAILKEV